VLAGVAPSPGLRPSTRPGRDLAVAAFAAHSERRDRARSAPARTAETSAGQRLRRRRRHRPQTPDEDPQPSTQPQSQPQRLFADCICTFNTLYPYIALCIKLYLLAVLTLHIYRWVYILR